MTALTDSTHHNPLYNPHFRKHRGSVKCPHEFDKSNEWLEHNFMGDLEKFKSKFKGRVNPSCWDCFEDVDESALIQNQKSKSIHTSDWHHPTALCQDLNFPEMSHVPWVNTAHGKGNQPMPVIAKGSSSPDTPISKTIAAMNGWKSDYAVIDTARCGITKKIGLCWYSYEERPDFDVKFPKYTEGAHIHKYEREDVPPSKFEYRVEEPPKKPDLRRWQDLCEEEFTNSGLTRVKKERIAFLFDKAGIRKGLVDNCIQDLKRRGIEIYTAKQDYENNIDELYFENAHQSMDLDSYAAGLPSIQPPNYSNSYENNEILLVMSLVIIICLCACVVVYLFGVLTGYIGSKILSTNSAKSQGEYGNINCVMSVNEDNEL